MMEFNEKLQVLRKQRGLTQEELAEALYVSRTAVSKWESGRGMPSIDSLKAIAKFFSVTIDELLSGEEVLTIAEEDSRQKEAHFRSLFFALADICAAMLLFLPFFGQEAEGVVRAVGLFGLTQAPVYLRVLYFAAVIGMTVSGAALLAVGNRAPWMCRTSLWINALGVCLFIAGRQTYSAIFVLVILSMKVWMLLKKR